MLVVSHDIDRVRPPDDPEFLIDSVNVILCDSRGGTYRDPKHKIELRIPDGAIAADIELEMVIGIFLYGNFEFPQQVSPVSPIVWLCTSQPNFSFCKPVQILIPHFVDCETNEDAANLQLQFMKAPHRSSTDANIIFRHSSGKQDFETDLYKGILYTQHFCYTCVTCGVNENQLRKRRLCISCAESKCPTGNIIFLHALR